MTKRPDEPKPTVLMFHARYRTPGGEEGSFNEEAKLFESLGYKVVRFEASNASMPSTFGSALSVVFNPSVFMETLHALKVNKPSLIYANNLWPALSPAVLWAAKFKKIPTLQAIRNYRMICPSAKLTNGGECLNCGATSFPMRCVMHGCYDNSRLKTLLVAVFSFSSRSANFGRSNHRYLSTSEITRTLLGRGGLSLDNVGVRPNFLSPTLEPSFDLGTGVAYVGRLSEEKGIRSLVSQWMELSDAPTLTLVGDGPLAQEIQALSNRQPNRLRWIGPQSGSQVLQTLRSSALTIVPSQWAEPFGRVAIESMSVGTPVLHTNGGALPEIVGDTGILLGEITAGELAKAIAVLQQPELLTELRHKSYARFQAIYSSTAARQNMRDHIESISTK